MDYLPDATVVMAPSDLDSILDQATADIEERYELFRHDTERPILRPDESFFAKNDVMDKIQARHSILFSAQSLHQESAFNVPSKMPPAMRIEGRYEDAIQLFLEVQRGQQQLWDDLGRSRAEP